MEGNGAAWSGVAGWADRARKAVADQAQAAYEAAQQSTSDVESGDFGVGAERWTSWAKGAADRARSGLAQAADKASSAEWGEHAKVWQGDLAQTFGKVSESAAKAGAGLSESAKIAQQKASLVAGSAKEQFEKAGSGLSGMGALAMSPGKLLQFGGMFMAGMFLISLSFSFLPLLPIKPQKFALLFALGSMTMLASVAWLKGPKAFASIAVQRDKLPFSGAYGVGLLGTLWATLIARSYVYTAVFALLQALGLLYFMASFIPGGKAVLNFFGRCTSRATRALVRSS